MDAKTIIVTGLALVVGARALRAALPTAGEVLDAVGGVLEQVHDALFGSTFGGGSIVPGSAAPVPGTDGAAYHHDPSTPLPGAFLTMMREHGVSAGDARRMVDARVRWLLDHGIGAADQDASVVHQELSRRWESGQRPADWYME